MGVAKKQLVPTAVPPMYSLRASSRITSVCWLLKSTIRIVPCTAHCSPSICQHQHAIGAICGAPPTVNTGRGIRSSSSLRRHLAQASTQAAQELHLSLSSRTPPCAVAERAPVGQARAQSGSTSCTHAERITPPQLRDSCECAKQLFPSHTCAQQSATGVHTTKTADTAISVCNL